MIATASRLQLRFPLLQALGVVAVFVYGTYTIVGFASAASINTMLVLAALLGVAALGQTLVVILGGLDLSIPGFIVAGALLSTALSDTIGFGPAVLTVVVAAGVVGGVIGFACHRYLLQPLVLTLATSSIVSGLALVWTTGDEIGAPPAWLVTFTSPATKTLGLAVPPLFVAWVLLAIIVAVVLHRTVFGRRIYATGANPRAAGLALVRTDRVWIAVFATSAAMSALVGVLLAGFAGADDANLGTPYLFQGLTAVIVGGTVFFGARGDYWHTVVGALFIIELSTVLIGKGLSNASQQMLFGLLILLVVAVYGRQPRVQDRV